MSKTLISAMKNEGPFILEWIAYHRVIGFDKIIIGSNDCEDGSDKFLDVLAMEGIISHRPNPVASTEDPQHKLLVTVLDHYDVRASEWLMVMDVDEFLCINYGNGRLDPLLTHLGDADAVTFLWKTFGDAGLDLWNGDLTIKLFERCEEAIGNWNRFHKTLFKNNGKFYNMSSHYPILADSVSVENVVIKNAGGAMYPAAALMSHFPRLLGIQALEHLWTWDNAYICHFPAKTRDLYLMKRYRGDVVPGIAEKKYADDSSYARLRHANSAIDKSLKKFLPEVQAEMANMRGSRRIRDAEREMMSAFERLRDKIMAPYAR